VGASVHDITYFINVSLVYRVIVLNFLLIIYLFIVVIVFVV
jgi:hypothetical protein